MEGGSPTCIARTCIHYFSVCRYAYELPEKTRLCLRTIETALEFEESRLTYAKDLIHFPLSDFGLIYKCVCAILSVNSPFSGCMICDNR